MGLFSFLKKKEQPVDQSTLNNLIAFSRHAIPIAVKEIQETNSFLPFGANLTTDGTFELVVYTDPAKKIIDHREHAMIIQKAIEEKYNDPKCRVIFMAFDGVAHLPTGDIDSINVRVSDKEKGVHKILVYPYKMINNQVELIDKDNPIIKDL